jgi:hypothetical protein
LKYSTKQILVCAFAKNFTQNYRFPHSPYQFVEGEFYYKGRLSKRAKNIFRLPSLLWLETFALAAKT